MVLKTKSCNLLTTLRSSSPNAAMADGWGWGCCGRAVFVVCRSQSQQMAEGPQKVRREGPGWFQVRSNTAPWQGP